VVGHGYNEFNGQLLAKLPADSLVTIAREDSVCVYVKGQVPCRLTSALKADELDLVANCKETRIWWE
jgi:hypothetical protein